MSGVKNFDNVSSISDVKYSCKWKGCPENSHSTPINQKKTGTLERGDYVGCWPHPNDIEASGHSPYRFYGRRKLGKSIRNLRFSRKGYSVIGDGIEAITEKRLKVTWPHYYKAENHHIFPCKAFEGPGLDDLRTNLELIGYNINNGEYNGMVLPRYKEEIVWHDLQAHRGRHPKTYRIHCESMLSNIQTDCLEYCKESEKDSPKFDPDLLFEEMLFEAQEIRNFILNWEPPFVHNPQLKWRDDAFSSSDFELSSVIPEPLPVGREYIDI